MNQPVLGVKGTAEYVKATGEGTAESPYIPVVQIEGGGGGGGTTNVDFGTKITDATMPAGGVDVLGWLSAIWKRITDSLPGSLGPKTAAASFPVTLSSDGAFATAFGTASDAAATSDTANTGHISLFKRFLQRTANWGLSATPWFAKSNTYFGTYTIAKNAEAVGYTAGDVYGTRFELTKDGVDFGVANGSFFLTGINLVSSLSTLPSGMGLFSLFLFDSEPTLIADNGAFILASSSITPQGIPLNSLSLITNSINSTSQTSQINELFRRGSSTLYGYLVTQSAFTPTNSAASTMTITLKAIEA